MATTVGDTTYRERTLFARKATGLVKGWAVRDAFIYSAFSINLITLGLFIFSYAVFVPDGSLLWAVVLSGAYLLLQVITYSSLIAAMPRAGGDYIWISRILGGGIGFVFAASIIVALLASLVISLGMRTYARIQKFCFFGGLVGLAFMFILLLVNSKADFISALNAQSGEVLGTSGDAYQGTVEAGALGTDAGSSVGDFGAVKGVFLLIPF